MEIADIFQMYLSSFAVNNSNILRILRKPCINIMAKWFN